jgi:hypothetical protein
MMFIVVRDLMNAPEFLPCDYVEVEPCAKPQAGEMMIATKEGAHILGRCAMNGSGGFDLVPLGQGYPRFSGATVDLVGVVIRHHRNLHNRDLLSLAA